MKLFALFFSVLFGICAFAGGAKADQNSDFYQIIVAQGQSSEVAGETYGRVSSAQVFLSIMNALTGGGHGAGVKKPLTFTFVNDPSGITAFTGTTTVYYFKVPICTEVEITVK